MAGAATCPRRFRGTFVPHAVARDSIPIGIFG
jgi:hypothetical protein